ncbi:MAG: GntR family transcriptional regulator [Desulfobacteraceae bacterium]|nr:GntR family transcriptional regulator [Desulfobacteraceae bacterium]
MNTEIYHTIKHRILVFDYQPGQILNEKMLAEEFGVSRTPLRQVLNRLEWDDLVRILPRTGTMVTQIEFPKMMNAYQVRFEIEALVGKLAAEQITTDHLSRLAGIHDTCSSLLDSKDKIQLTRLDREFRDLLFEAADNPVLEAISRRLYDLTQRLWYATLDRGEWTEVVEGFSAELEHTRRAWMAKDPEAAGRTRREHLVSHFDRIRSKYLSLPQ